MSNRITRGGVSRTATISVTSIPRDRELKSSCAPWFWLLQVSAVLESIRLSASVVARVRCRLRCCEKISNNFGGLSERVTTALVLLSTILCFKWNASQGSGVIAESVLAVRGLGVQLFTSQADGRQMAVEFVDDPSVASVVVNEAIQHQRVGMYLLLVLAAQGDARADERLFFTHVGGDENKRRSSRFASEARGTSFVVAIGKELRPPSSLLLRVCHFFERGLGKRAYRPVEKQPPNSSVQLNILVPQMPISG